MTEPPPYVIGGTRQARADGDADFLLKIAAMHLDRAKQLADREWKTMVLYWGVLLASGTALITAASKATPSLANIIVHWDWLILLGYGVSATVYLVGYSGNIHQSLVTERNRYQHLQDLALDARGVAPGLRLRPKRLDRATIRWWLLGSKTREHIFQPVPRRQVFRSGTWGVKAITTPFFITGIWFVAQLAALPKTNGPHDPSCAFVTCVNGPAHILTLFGLEVGTILAIVTVPVCLLGGLCAIGISDGP